MRVSHLLKCIGFALAVPLVLCVGLVVFALTPWGLQTAVSLRKSSCLSLVSAMSTAHSLMRTYQKFAIRRRQ